MLSFMLAAGCSELSKPRANTTHGLFVIDQRGVLSKGAIIIHQPSETWYVGRVSKIFYGEFK